MSDAAGRPRGRTRGEPPPWDVGAVFFDAVFTLIRPHPPSAVVYAETAARHGITADPSALGEALRLLWVEHRARKRADTLTRGTSEAYEKAWWRDVVRGAFAAATGAPCSDECFEAIFARYATKEVWTLAAGARETLTALRARGVVTGIVSNYDARLGAVVDAFELRPLLDVIAWSGAVGWEKPDAPIFHEAARRAGVPAARCLHVGDELEADVRGALGAGFHALWLTTAEAGSAPESAAPPAAADRPAPVVHALPEVLDYVRATAPAGQPPMT